MLGRLIPLALALEIGLTGDRIDAARALSFGLVNRVVPADQVLDEAVALATRIAQNGPLGVQATKKLMRDALDVDPDELWERQTRPQRVGVRQRRRERGCQRLHREARTQLDRPLHRERAVSSNAP